MVCNQLNPFLYLRRDTLSWVCHKLQKNIAQLGLVPLCFRYGPGTLYQMAFLALLLFLVLAPYGFLELALLLFFMVCNNSEILKYVETLHNEALWQMLTVFLVYSGFCALTISLIRVLIVQPFKAILKVSTTSALPPLSPSPSVSTMQRSLSMAALQGIQKSASGSCVGTFVANDGAAYPMELEVLSGHELLKGSEDLRRSCLAVGSNVSMRSLNSPVGECKSTSFEYVEGLLYIATFFLKLVVIGFFYLNIYYSMLLDPFLLGLSVFISLIFITQVEVLFYSVSKPLGNYTYLFTILIVYFISYTVFECPESAHGFRLCDNPKKREILEFICEIKKLWSINESIVKIVG